MLTDLHAKFVIETDSIIVAEVVDFDKEQALRGGDRLYPTFTIQIDGEYIELVKYGGKNYRQVRLFGSLHVKPEITEDEIRVYCGGPIKILDNNRRSSLDD